MSALWMDDARKADTSIIVEFARILPNIVSIECFIDRQKSGVCALPGMQNGLARGFRLLLLLD